MSDKEFYEGLKALRSELLFTEIVLKNGYDPHQPRVPAGVSTGGQWTDGGSNGGTVTPSRSPRVYQTEEELFAQPDSGAVDPLFDEIVAGIVSAMPAGTPIRAAWMLWLRGPRHKVWKFGTHKKEKYWAKYLTKRNWTPEEIDETLAHGKRYRAPNKVNKQNTATRYENKRTGKYLVIDDKTKEILHLGKADYKRDKLWWQIKEQQNGF